MCKVYFVLLYPPTVLNIDLADDDYAAVVGGTVTLVCGTNVNANTAPTVAWLDNNGAMVSDGGRYSLNNGPDSVSLTITNVMAGDDGSWSCEVSAGSLTKGRTMNLTVVGECCV